jgi:hypothetical protein
VGNDDHLDVPPGSETAEASDEVNWREISARVDEVAAEAPPPPRVSAQNDDPDKDQM